mmetsp:Transcript_11711/g.17745  ORF Transcript_11711/g.17745 Transcript_11711/m.17745 type:complete len:138 (-) Transcript_11711:151-564(-)
MKISAAHILLINICAVLSYPEGSLRCYHTTARPDRQVICPQSRNSYCMKEVTNLPQSLCGKTQYFGDRFKFGECTYKKCINECVEGEYQFEFEGQKYNRKRFCCNNENLCNGGSSLRNQMSLGLGTVAVAVALYALL